jgi:hypothetical protein
MRVIENNKFERILNGMTMPYLAYSCRILLQGLWKATKEYKSMSRHRGVTIDGV